MKNLHLQELDWVPCSHWFQMNINIGKVHFTVGCKKYVDFSNTSGKHIVALLKGQFYE